MNGPLIIDRYLKPNERRCSAFLFCIIQRVSVKMMGEEYDLQQQ